MVEITPIPLWQIVFVVIGIISSVALILNLFVLSGPAKKELSFEKEVSTTDASVLSTLSCLTNSSIQDGGEITILNNGDDFYPELYRSIESADTSIAFSVYIWKPGVVSDKVFELLTKKAREGVVVRVIIDGFGGKTAPKEDVEKLREAGAKVEIFHPLSFGKFTKFHKRNHARAIVIDEKIGYTGGMAISDYWLGNATDKDHWRDMMFKISGPALNHLNNSFTALWEVSSGEILSPSLLFQKEQNTSMKSISLTSFSPDEDTQKLSTFFAVSIASAQKSILIVTPYMVLEDQVQQALIESAQRGVNVRVILPGKIIDSKVVQTASQHYYRDLLDGRVKIYEYSPTMLHSKAMVIDDIWSVIGSANIDTRSSFYNVENIIGIYDEKFAKTLNVVLEEDIKKAVEVTSQSWKKRNIVRKILEPIMYTFDKQL